MPEEAVKKERIRLVDPDGNSGTVDKSELGPALAAGFRPETEDERHSRSIGTGAAAALAAAKGSTFGLAGVLADKAGEAISGLRSSLGQEAQEPSISITAATKLAEEKHPILSVATQAATGAATLGLSGFSGLAQAAGRKIAGKASDKLIARAAQGAVQQGVAGALEGSVLGAGNLVSEEAIGNAEYNAESIISHIGGSALVGGAFGGVFGGGAEFLKGGSSALRRSVSSRLSKQAAKQADEAAAVAEKADDLVANEAADVFRESAKDAGEVSESVLETSADAWVPNALGVKKGALKSTLRRVGKTTFHKALRRIRQVEIDGQRVIRAGDTADDVAPRIRAYVDKSRDTVRETAKAVDSINPTAISGDDIADEILASADKYVGGSEIPDMIAARRAAEEIAATYRGRGLSMDQAYKDRGHLGRAWRSNRDSVKSEIDRIAERAIKRHADSAIESTLDDAAVKSYREANNDLHMMIELASHSDNEMLSSMGNNYMGLVNPMVGAAAMAGKMAQGARLLEAGIGGAALAAGMKVVRPRVASTAIRGLEWASKSPLLSEASERISKISNLSDAAEATTRAIDKSVDALMSGRRLVIAGGAQQMGPQVLNGISFSDSAELSKDSQESAKRIAKELEQLSGNHQMLRDKLSGSVAAYSSSAPEHSAAIATKLSGMVEFLSARAPKNPLAGYSSMTPEVDDWMPSKAEAASFSRYVRAATRPLSVVEDLSRGAVSTEAAETLKELYPELYTSVQQKIISANAARKKRLPYSDRVNLSILFGSPLDPTMEPEFIASLQSGLSKQPAQGQGGGGMRLTSLDKIDPAEGLATRSTELGDAGGGDG